jgi:hypothetical protein
MDWQTPLAIGLSIGAGVYALWRWTRPFFERDTPPTDLLQIDTPED